MTGQKTPAVLGTEKIGKLLVQYVIPAIVAITASSLCNIVDSIFIGHRVDAMAIPGLVLTFPLMSPAAAFGSLVDVGTATLISVKLGQKDYGIAQRVLRNVSVLNLIIGTLLTVIIFPFLDPVLYFFGRSDKTVKYVRESIQIILLGNMVTHLYLGLNTALRALGHPRRAMVVTITIVIINILLAPLFIFVFDWGVHGTATIMVCTQLIALVWQLHLFYRRDGLTRLRKGIFRSKWKTVLDSLAIGMFPLLANMASCFIVTLINQGLKEHEGDSAIDAFGIINRIVFVFIMIVLGLNRGMQPIAGYNFGARLYPRVTEVLKVTICCAAVVAAVGFLIGMSIPETVFSIFTSDEELISIASRGFRIVVFFHPIVGFQMVASNLFQNIGMVSRAIFLSLAWQMLSLAPCLLILPHYYGQMGIRASMPVANSVASLISGRMSW